MALEQEALSEDEREIVLRYAEDGYVVFDFPAEAFDRHAADVRALFASGELVRHGRIQDAWRSSDAVRTLAVHPEVLLLLRLLYRREPIPFQTLNFPAGTEQATHSDTIHFHCVPHRFMCGVWVALEDIDDQNGPLHVYPGSHKLPVWDMHDVGLPSGRESYHAYEEAIRAVASEIGLPKKQVHLQKGQALIWAANLLHGGEPILDKKRTRMSQVTHYYFSGCLYYTPMHSDPYLGKVAIREITNIIDGKTVPNVYGGMPIDSMIFERLRGEARAVPGGQPNVSRVKRATRRIMRMLKARALPQSVSSRSM